MHKLIRDNALSLAMFALFAVCGLGQSVAGMLSENEQRAGHGLPALTYGAYLQSGDFLEATFENWESEFLQMAAFIVLSALLVQRGSAESRDPDHPEDDPHEADPRRNEQPDSPWPVHRGGLALVLYSRSLSIALFALFLLSFALHAVGGARRFNEEALAHGQATLGTLEYAGTSEFWFESMQNWQSEFLSVGALIVLSIFLRQKGSPESKPVHAPHSQTGPE